MKNNKGISLIVLSITILVMAILAATAIIALEDSGIIGRAKNTTKNSNYADEYTRLTVIKNGILTDNLGTITVEEYITELTNKGLIESTIVNNADGSKTVTTKTGFEVKISQNGTSDLSMAINGYTQPNNTSNNNSSGSDDTTNNDDEVTDNTTKVTLTNGEGTSSSPYTIATVDELVSLATQVNSGYSSSGVYFRLDTDLDLSSVTDWQEIGNGEATAFEGVFDGNGYRLSYLASTNGGLFGYSYGALKNVSLSYFEICEASEFLGILAGRNYGSIENCQIYDSSIEGTNFIGGLVGVNGSGASIINVGVQNSIITGENYVGGCAGQNVSTIQDTAAENCTITGNSIVGGLVGGNVGELTNCMIAGMSQTTLTGQNSGTLEDCTVDGIVSTE